MTRVLGHPQPGFWAVRLAKGAPEVAARIAWQHTTVEPGDPGNPMERSPFLFAEINGEVVDLDAVWLRKGREITADEYAYLLADRKWCAKYAPHLPEAHPKQRPDIRAMRAPF